jgi:Fic family protein
VSFVRIHPFFDGNGRIARLLANLPVLYAGFPPIVIPAEARLDYIRELWSYQQAAGVVSAARTDLLPDPERLGDLKKLLGQWWRTTLDLVAEAKHGTKA